MSHNLPISEDIYFEPTYIISNNRFIRLASPHQNQTTQILRYSERQPRRPFPTPSSHAPVQYSHSLLSTRRNFVRVFLVYSDRGSSSHCTEFFCDTTRRCIRRWFCHMDTSQNPIQKYNINIHYYILRYKRAFDTHLFLSKTS